MAIALSSFAFADDFFEQRIRPVLVERCFNCHSTSADRVKGSLLLDSLEGMTKGGESGQAAVVPGDVDASLLVEAIRYRNSDLQMPPNGPLSPVEVEAFEQWIRDGAAFPAMTAPIDPMTSARKHWAFQPRTRPAIPEVRDAAWPRTDVDRFILARLEENDLRPSPEADRRTLIRRLSFDLRGLPPSPEEVTAFESDSDPSAYEKIVDRYLASPQYGERWARHWLDVARYADTKGYVYDREEVKFVHGYTYRDWVVNALNDDMPYDEFIRLQLAADVMTGDDSREHLAAMGFLTLGQRFLGVMPDIIDDRIDTVSRGLMGLTVGCARCHDHKFDPVPTADYYSLYGVFSACSERTVPLRPGDLEKERYAAFAEGMNERQTKLNETFEEESLELEVRLRQQVDRYLAAVPTADSLPTDDFYEIRNAEDLNPTIVRKWAAFIAKRGAADPVFGPWNRLAALPPDRFADSARAVLAGYATPNVADGDIVFAADSGSPIDPNGAVIAALDQSPPNAFADVANQYARLFKSVNDEWLSLLEQSGDYGTQTPEFLPNPDREAIRAVLFAHDSPIRVQDGAIVDLEWMFDENTRVDLAKLYAKIDQWIVENDPAPDYAVILVDKPDFNPPRIFRRGNPANPGPEVPRQFLSLLAGENRQPFENGSGRRELADAIASPDNPLTARVFVNRVWAWHFGEGLVETLSDFGTRSAPPSHPELLDWLANDFVDNGWSLKHLHRRIVLSAAYRQVSNPGNDARSLEIDPDNRLLSHFNRHRLDFESILDALLSASGDIDLALGGRPIDLANAPYSIRRTIYGRVDRRFLPAIYRVFDFPNPDMHSPQRSDTTVPQQALFLMNNPFVQQRARTLAAASASATADAARVDWLIRRAYQRPASLPEIERALDFVKQAQALTPPTPPDRIPSAWSYGYATIDPDTGLISGFAHLEHFSGEAWQMRDSLPEGEFGWLSLTRDGGHPGRDLDHAVVRRWTAPFACNVKIEGRIVHEPTQGDGIMARIVSSRHGLLESWHLLGTTIDGHHDGIAVEAGDTLDFEVDINGTYLSDEFFWTPTVVLTDAESTDDRRPNRWNAVDEFAGPPEEPIVPMSGWEKFAQVLLTSNEFLFVD